MSNPHEPRLVVPVGDGDHVQGAADSPLTLVEYGDFECPHCAKAHPAVQEIQRRLGPELRFVFRNFPLGRLHPHAQQAAEAAESAGAQGRFWEMHDRLFESLFALETADLVGYARDLGLDVARFEAELAQGTYRALVRESFLSGARSGVNGTPTFYINGARYNGEPTVEGLLEGLEQAR
jgi:protein-disulfide isomerase